MLFDFYDDNRSFEINWPTNPARLIALIVDESHNRIRAPLRACKEFNA
jgi:hypothetical protein